MYLYGATMGSSLIKNRSKEDIRTENYISRTIGKELITSVLSRAKFKDITSAKLQVKGPKQAETIQTTEIAYLRKQLDSFPEGLKENARVTYLLDQNNKRKDLQDFQCSLIDKFANILRLTLTEQGLDFKSFRIGGYDKGPYGCEGNCHFKFMTKALLVTALRLTFGNTMLKSNSLIDKLFDSFDYKRTDQMDWRSFLYLFTILMQPQSPFNIHLRWGYSLYSSLGSLDLDCTESTTIGSLKDMITSPVVLALQVAVKTDFDTAWFNFSMIDPEAMKLAARASSSSTSNDSDLIKIPFHIFRKLLNTEPFAKYTKCCTVYGKRDKRQWTSFLEENFYHPRILVKLKELRRKRRNDTEADKFLSLKSRREKVNCMSLWRQYIKRRNALRLVLIDFEMRSTLGNTGIFFDAWKKVTIFLTAIFRVQRVVRGFIARKRRNFIRKLQGKALKVQSGTRQLLVKLKYRKKYYKFFWAAVTIQRHFRGRRARVRVRSIVEAIYDLEKKKLVKERAEWMAKRKEKAAIAIQMAARKMILRRRTMKKMAEKAKLEMTARQMDRLFEEAMLVKKVHRLKLTDWYVNRKMEHDKDLLDESQTREHRKAIIARRSAQKRAEIAKQNAIREAQLERLEEEKVELWLKKWEETIEQRGIDRRRKCQNIISLPENQAEILLKQQFLKRINAQMKEVLRRADRMKIPMELPEAKEIATKDIIEEEVQLELTRARAEMKAESLAIQKADEEKAEAKRQQEKADKKRKRRWAVVTLQSYMRIFLARKELRRRAYSRYECHFDPKTHNYYYTDKATLKTFWEKPKSLGSYDIPMRDSWVVMYDSEGDRYYYNVKTWKQTWDLPTGCMLCEKCSANFCVAKLSYDGICYCNSCLYEMAESLLAMDYDSTQIKFKPFNGDETVAVITDFRKIPEKTWFMHTLEIGSNLKLTAEEEEQAILAKALRDKKRREKAEKKKQKLEKIENKKKKKKKKGQICEACTEKAALVKCFSCSKVFCQECFAVQHALEGYGRHETQTLEGDYVDSEDIKLPAIDTHRSMSASTEKGKKKKKGRKKVDEKGASSESDMAGSTNSIEGKKRKKKTGKKKKNDSSESDF